MRYYSEETVKKIMTKVEVDSFPSNLYDTSLRTVERIYPDLNKFDSIEIPESPWHTEMPTEEGWYLLKVRHEDEIVYYANLLENNTDLQWHYAMYGKIIAYKEIKP